MPHLTQPKTPQYFLHQILEQHQNTMQPMPSKAKAHFWIDRLIDALFPVRCAEMPTALGIRQLELQLWELLLPVENQIPPIEDVVKIFFNRIAYIYNELQKDAQAILIHLSLANMNVF